MKQPGYEMWVSRVKEEPFDHALIDKMNNIKRQKMWQSAVHLAGRIMPLQSDPKRDLLKQVKEPIIFSDSQQS